MASKQIIYSAKKIFTGQKWLTNKALIIEDNRIVKIEAIANPLHEKIVPAFIDNQIYGAHDLLFSTYQNVESLKALYHHCTSNGTAYFLPTVATNSYEVLFNCIDAIKQYNLQEGKGCIGLHVEGPWINTLKKGAHIANLIHEPTIKQVKELLNYGKGTIKLITLAPECCSKAVIKLIQSYNIIISIGHSNANYKQAYDAFNLGIQTCTHLFNAMPSLHHREDNLLTAIFNHKNITSSIIPDGHHVSFKNVEVAKKIMGNRLYAITDAVTTNNRGYYTHQFQKDKYVSEGILSGSSLTMHQAFINLVKHCNINETEALKMCTIYPAKVLQLHNKIGCIKKGVTANFLIFDESYSLNKIVINNLA